MEQHILASLSLHAKTMVVTCWLETLANKDDLTKLIFMVAYGHSKKTTNSSAGVPLFGTLFEQVERLAQRTRVTRRLNKESRQPESQRSKATRVIRLMEKGEVDGNH